MSKRRTPDRQGHTLIHEPTACLTADQDAARACRKRKLGNCVSQVPRSDMPKEVPGVAQHHTPCRSEGMLLNNNRSNGHSRLTKKEELRELRAGECCTSIAFVASRDTLTYLYGQQHVFDWAGRQGVRMGRCTENAPLVIGAGMWRARELGISCIFSDYDGTNASTCTKIKLLEKNTVRKQGAHQDQIDGAIRHMQPQCHHRGRQQNHDSEKQHGGAIVTYRSIAPRDVK